MHHIGKIKHDALQQAFLQTMDNDKSNDALANARIAQLAQTMSDAQISAAYQAAHAHAEKKNSKKNGFLDRKDPYKNADSLDTKLSHLGALRANDWMQRFPCVPPMLWNLFRGCGCW